MANRAATSEKALANFTKTYAKDQKALLGGQKKEQEGLFKNYEKIRRNQEALPNLYSRLQNEAGIPDLNRQAQGFKDEIFKTKGLLDRLGEDLTARTTGTLTTEAQRRRLQAAEEEPLQTNLGRLGTGLAPISEMLSSANSSVSTRLGLESEQQERALEGTKLRINSISDRFARELTGFTQSKQVTLTGILEKLKRDRQLDDRDWQLAQQLASEERSYARQKASAVSSLSRNSTTGGGGGAPARPTAAYSQWSGGGTAKPLQSTYNPQGSNYNPIQQGGFSLQGSGANSARIGSVSVARPTSRLAVR